MGTSPAPPVIVAVMPLLSLAECWLSEWVRVRVRFRVRAKVTVSVRVRVMVYKCVVVMPLLSLAK